MTHRSELQDGSTRRITVGSGSVVAEVAASEAAREQGLSGRFALAPDAGMLFVFQEPGSPGIWMKDMLFAIDIVWLQEDGTVITVAQDVSPATYPQAFYPSRPEAAYVLELPAGFAAAHNLAEGSKIVL